MKREIVAIVVMLTYAVSSTFSQSFDVQSDILGYRALESLANNHQLRVDLELAPAVAVVLKERFEEHQREYRRLTNTFALNSAELREDRKRRIRESRIKLRTIFEPKMAAELEELLTPEQRRAFAWTFLRGKCSTVSDLFFIKSFQEYLQIDSDTATKIRSIFVEQTKSESELAQKQLLESVDDFPLEQQDRIRDIVGIKLMPVPIGRNYKLSPNTPVPVRNNGLTVSDLCASEFHREYVNLRPSQLNTINSWVESSRRRRFDASALNEIVGPDGLQNLLDKEQYVLLGQIYAQSTVHIGGLPKLIEVAAYKQYIAPTSEQLRAVADLEIGHAIARQELQKRREREAIDEIVVTLSPVSRLKLRELLGEELSFRFAVGKFD